jgi:hypothetical protein
MWMPAEKQTLQATTAFGGSVEVVGVLDRPPQTHTLPPTFVGGTSLPLTTLRMVTSTGQVVQCRFEGMLSGQLDRGDKVYVSGRMVAGVIEANCIRMDGPAGPVIGQSGPCFVATVAFGNQRAPEVRDLRRFRDLVLARSAAGRAAIALYWRVGPVLARFLERKPRICRVVRVAVLSPLSRIVAKVTPDDGPGGMPTRPG